MARENPIAEHWGRGDVYALILSALEQASKSLNNLTVEDLAPVDHFHARGFPATVELGDRLPIQSGQHILDIGCGLGGPARYLAQRFQCSVSGIDITQPFVETANKLTSLLGMEDRITVEQGDACQLPYADGVFDGAYTQHVTMNVADRARFFAEAYRVLKPGAFFCAHGTRLGARGQSALSLAVVRGWQGCLSVTAIGNLRPFGGGGLYRYRGRGYRRQIPGSL